MEKLAIKNILITGGTGFIGKHLSSLLLKKGYSISILTRTPKKNSSFINYYSWDISKKYIDEEAIKKADYIIHLAGENIFQKSWTNKQKEKIVKSRTESTKTIYFNLKKYNKKIHAFISASAIGIYGSVTSDEICFEDKKNLSPDFLSITCEEWEKSANSIENLNIRVVKLRTGLVLKKDEGILKKLAPLFKYKLGAILGSGKQYLPWIHIDDLCNMYLEAIENIKMKGAYNATVEDNTTNENFSKTLAKIFKNKIWLPNVPKFIIHFFLGKRANLILNGQRVSSKKIKQLGFKFKYENLETALRKCLKKKLIF